jgi:threonine dehydrogenase-like Zn-dependent dehydrogenase
MLGLWLENNKLSLRNDIPIPTPEDGEALIKVNLAGICSTDLELVRGYYPFTGILGHEFVGEVISAPKHHEWIGKRVVGEINITCGKCDDCLAGRPTHCINRTVLGILNHNGAFAEYLILPIRNLHEIPNQTPDTAAVFTEPLAAALEIQQQIHITPETNVLVVGAGRLGQLIAQSLAITSCDLSVVARYPNQIKILQNNLIKTISENDVKARKYDLVIEATGSQSGFALARKAIHPRGTIALKSTYKGNINVSFSSIVVDEINLVGSRCGPFPPAIRLLEKIAIDTSPLISKQFPLSQALEAFDLASKKGTFKVLLTP